MNFSGTQTFIRASQVALVVKNPPANARDVRDPGLIPGSGRPLGEGNGDPLLYSCLENPMDRGAWRTSVHGVAKSQAQLSIGMTSHWIPRKEGLLLSEVAI